MISIIICSYQKEVAEKAIQSIQSTIGELHEIIIIENSKGQLGICEAYNQGGARAKFDILCFMHEDITFETNNWGVKIINHLHNKEVGLIGVAGGDTKSLVPSTWASMTFKSEISMVQHYKFKNKPTHKIIETGYAESNHPCKQVACIDGVWMCTRKDVFEKYKFDQINLTGFHGYDIDYSLQVNAGYKVCVVFDVLIHHYSEGVLGDEWLASSLIVSKKWGKKLPFSVRQISRAELIRQHWTSMNVFIDKMIELDYDFLFMLTQLFKFSFNKLYNFRHSIHSLKKIMFK